VRAQLCVLGAGGRPVVVFIPPGPARPRVCAGTARQGQRTEPNQTVQVCSAGHGKNGR